MKFLIILAVLTSFSIPHTFSGQHRGMKSSNATAASKDGPTKRVLTPVEGE